MPGPLTLYNKTRIAPTPSGFLHLGNVHSFAITAALARKSGAKILLRIDDLDRERVNKPYLQDIFDTLNFLEIPWDEGPRDAKDFEDNYSQLHRMPLYKAALKQLADESLVFACTCSRRQIKTCACLNKQIPLSTESASWRLITDNRTLSIKTHNGQLIQASLPAGMQNFIVKKKDGFPAYQLSSLIDDLFYGIDLVVRGEDLWESTLAQHFLALALGMPGFNQVAFHHHPLITDISGKKLSKSEGATSVHYLSQTGKTAGDIYALLAAMPGNNVKAAK